VEITDPALKALDESVRAQATGASPAADGVAPAK